MRIEVALNEMRKTKLKTIYHRHRKDCITLKLIASLFAYIIRHRENCLLLAFKQIRHTYGIVYVNFKTLEIKSLYFQTSMKNAWLIPHYEPSHGSNSLPLAGWLLWYAGCTTEGLICPVSEYDIPFFGKQQAIKDKQGNLYMVATTDIDIIRKHKACLQHGGQPKAHFNRFTNTITYSD